MKITKERAKDILEFGAGRIISPITDDEIRELARIALASIKAEPVAYMYKDNLHADARFSLHKRFGNWSQEDINEYEITEIPLYTAAPAPAPANAEPVAWLWSHRKHPSEVSLVRPEDDERAEGAHWSGWSCQALYAVPPAQVSEPDRSMFEKWWESEHGSPLDSWDSLRTTDGYCDDGIDGQFEAWNACRAAMLQGVEQPQSAQQNIPEIIPATQFKPVADLYGLTSPTGGETSFTFDAVEARDFIDGGWSCQEYVELERFQEAITNHTEDKLAMVDHSGDSNNMVEPVTTANKLLDGWVACSERMPEDDDFVYIWPRPDFGVELHVGQYCECHPKGDGWYAQVYEQNYGIEWCPITVTHWMPLPAAPKQELK
ncbi:DUF551 domain-containing protein [Enterobacter roggenkampii]|uniref:DUF551 domain-containing protein n=1 Tax=Enterobacter roggenkampii TaxID=1812935 RepID=UPI001F417A3D|nr:DUF551 domain-containing protein [Enterobacter roggenkampii]